MEIIIGGVTPDPLVALAKQAGVTPSYRFARRKLSTSQQVKSRMHGRVTHS